MAKSSKQNVIQMSPPDPLWDLGSDLDVIETHDVTHLIDAAGAIRALGAIVFSYHCDEIEGLNSEDIQGIGLAIKSLGQHVQGIEESLEHHFSSMRKAITALGGEE